MRSTNRCLVVLLGVAGISGLTPARPAAAQAVPDRLLAVDVIGGGVPHPDPTPGEEEPDKFAPMGGWQVGSSLRFLNRARWLGVAASYARHSNDEVAVRDVLIGARATSPWLTGNEAIVRGFAHALIGHASARPKAAGQPSGSSPELVVGAGFDVFLFRMQFDYVRTDLPLVPRNGLRVFIGGFVPLCFRGCRPEWEDGIPVRRR
jgi:hypothetical protein